MKHLAVVVFAACGALFAPFSDAQKAVNIQQTGSPLNITEYSAKYVEGGRYSTEGVMHAVTITNVGTQNVDAYTISFRAFDAFNEDMGRGLGGVSISTLAPNGTTKGSWSQAAYAAFSFEKYGTGVAYVSKVRLADGTVWSANEKYVLTQLQKIQDDLTADIFKTKDPK